MNTTSRFEGLTKYYGVPAIAGRGTLAPGFAMLELDSVMVKGRTQPTQLYTFVDMLKTDPAHVDELGIELRGICNGVPPSGLGQSRAIAKSMP